MSTQVFNGKTEFRECSYYRHGTVNKINGVLVSPSGELKTTLGFLLPSYKATNGWVFRFGSSNYALHIAIASTYLPVTGTLVRFRDNNIFNTDLSNLYWDKKSPINRSLCANLLEGLQPIKYYSHDNSLFESTRYGITPDGLVQSMYTGRVLKYSLQPCGGYGVRIDNHFCILVHRAVASTFLSKQVDENVLTIKDGNIQNCHVDNLEWGKAKKYYGKRIDRGVFARYIYSDGAGFEFDSLLVNVAGEVQSLVTGKILKHAFQNKSIYVHHTDDKQYALNLARLLLSTFKYIDNLTNYKVGFKDNNCFNTELSNLYWVV